MNTITKKNTALEAAQKLKQSFIEMSDEDFEHLTFGELKKGQKFIGLPVPGDNEGHGGFKGIYHIFIKTTKSCTSYSMKDLFDYRAKRKEEPTGGLSINFKTGTESEFPNSMPVILVA